MVFSSLTFIYVFLPLFFICYYLLPKNGRNSCLYFGSIIFYAIGSIEYPFHIFLFFITLVVNFFMGLLIEKRKHANVWLMVGVGFNVLLLVACKYSHLILTTWNSYGGNVVVPPVLAILPIGISFYMFQSISYLCDVYHKKCRAEESFVDFGTYLSMFPQLIAGPIVQYPYIEKKLHHRKYSLEQFLEGLEIFILGLGSKVILANRIGSLWTKIGAIGYESISTPLAWMGIIAFTFQIYFDFWGYSLMAMGLGKMLGFTLPQNFDYPYLSTSMTEFWRRWHITLGNWFKEYVYIPLGGNRRSKWKTFRNLLIVWLLTGFWHGASWNFPLWGMVLFLITSIEKMGLKNKLDRFPFLGHCYMAAIVPLTWAIFAITDGQRLLMFFKKLFAIPVHTGGVFVNDYVKYGKEYGIYLLLCVLFTTRIPQRIYREIKNTYFGKTLIVGIFLYVIYNLYMGLDDPFLYYKF